ncbi:MAG: hypothetical protein FD134_102 [Gallionellaceae bacterium]|nr:MAG: hypothetical protein FD134_102 [Gallionellaceae bacterium]
MIGAPRHRRQGSRHHPARRGKEDGIWWNVAGDHAVSSDHGTITDRDATEHARTGVNINIVADFRSSWNLSCTQCYVMKNDAVFADFDAPADHDVGRMDEAQAGADARPPATGPQVDVVEKKRQLEEPVQYPHRDAKDSRQ